MDRRKIAMIAAAAGGSQGRRALSLLDANVVFLGRSDVWDDYSQLSVDQSSLGVDLTDAAFGAASTDHAPTTGLLESRTVDILVRIAEISTDATPVTKLATNANEIAWTIHQRSSDNAMTVRTSAGDGTATTHIALAPPSLSATAQDYYVAWSMRPNPDLTGDSDARISELRIWNLDTEEYAEDSEVHALRTYDPVQLRVGAHNPSSGFWNWAANGENAMRHVRISNVARSREELEALIPLIIAGEAP